MSTLLTPPLRSPRGSSDGHVRLNPWRSPSSSLSLLPGNRFRKGPRNVSLSKSSPPFYGPSTPSLPSPPEPLPLTSDPVWTLGGGKCTTPHGRNKKDGSRYRYGGRKPIKRDTKISSKGQCSPRVVDLTPGLGPTRVPTPTSLTEFLTLFWVWYCSVRKRL